MTALSAADRVYLGSRAVDRVYRGAVQVWPYTTIVDPGYIHPSATFSRLTAGTYWGADKLIHTAAPGTPRWEHDPLTGALRGLLIEAQATNLALYSDAIGGATWGLRTCTVVTGQLGREGAYDATLIVPDSGTLSFPGPYTENTGYASPKVRFGQCDVHYGDYRYAAIGFHNTSGLSATATFDLSAAAVLDTGWHPSAATGMRAHIVPLGDGWFRLGVAVHVADAEFPTHIGSFYASGGSAVGGIYNRIITADGVSGILTMRAYAALTDSALTRPISHIPTSGAAATRAADILTYPRPVAAGTLLIEHDAPAGKTLIDCGGAVLVSQGPGKIALAWDASGSMTVQDGAAGTPGAALSWTDSDMQLLPDVNAILARCHYYQRRLSESELQEITA